jgi:hypothetical protein
MIAAYLIIYLTIEIAHSKLLCWQKVKLTVGFSGVVVCRNYDI